MSAGAGQGLAEGDSVTRGTAAVMLLMSVLSWVVILYKLWFMARARRSVPRAMDAFWQMPDLAQAQTRVQALDAQGLVRPMVAAVQQSPAAHQSPSLGQNAAHSQRLMRQLRAALGTLAGSGQVDIAQLAGPVGEALVMTAAGLAVALPAVLAYNLLGRASSTLEALLEGFAHDLQAQFGQND